jgi:CubicO group peptidase (beta-lactamase class C family)
MPSFEDTLHAVDEKFAKQQADAKIPGVAWGVIRGGELVHAGGAGTTRDGEARTPDADTIFRIASMTKSFTAATMLSLRDEGRLRLDDPVEDWVPALQGWRHPAADAPAITLRHLLTMSAGVPTDDPWGDRQQGLPLDDFAALLSARPTFAWPPGTQFDYSNLGYGILGRVITAASGREYKDAVRDRLLGPLEMADSAYEESELDPDRLAHGYVRRDDVLVREGTDPYGALASMGGLYSTVRDLARWVAFHLDAFPARSDPDDGPVRRSSRREMAQVQRMVAAERDAAPAHESPLVEAAGYGFGLFIVSRPEIGTVVGHGGGYPGYGTMMSWHPASGIGVVSGGNLRYGPVHELTRNVLLDLVRADDAPRRPFRVLRSVDEHRVTVSGLLERWDDAVADEAFAMNMDLDEPREARRAAVAKAVEQVGGPFRLDETREETSISAAHRRWWLRGQRGWLYFSMLVSPEPRPRIQALRVVATLDPSETLSDMAGRLVAASGPGGAWPDTLEAGEKVDRAVVLRGLRIIAAWLGDGPVTLGALTGGDGTTTATWELGAPAAGTLRIALDKDTGALAEVEVSIAERLAAMEAW